MNGQPSILAAEFPPNIQEFFPPSIAPWGGDNPWFTRITLMVWIATAVIIIFFLVAYRNPQMVPTRRQWIAESIYGFGRNSIAKEMIGADGVRFAPYLTSLFLFIFVVNLFAMLKSMIGSLAWVLSAVSAKSGVSACSAVLPKAV